MTEETLEHRTFRAEEARQFKEHPCFKLMFDTVATYLEDKALSCDPDDPKQAARVVLSKQILASLRREIERRIEDGEVAKFHLAELERRSVFDKVRKFVR